MSQGEPKVPEGAVAKWIVDEADAPAEDAAYTILRVHPDGELDQEFGGPFPPSGAEVVVLADILSALLSDEVVEAVGYAMEDWVCRMHGIVASSHRPGTQDDGREAKQILQAAIEKLGGAQ